MAEEKRLNRRETMIGIVVGDKMDKSITVKVEMKFTHPMYGKVIRRHKKFMAHDEKNEAGIGDRVEIMGTRPYSKNKRMRLVRIIEKAKRLEKIQ